MNAKEAKIKSNRKLYIDFLRIIAIFMVLFNHTSTNGFLLFTVARSSVLYPFYIFNAIFIKVAVPLFFMASGALLLGKNESYLDVLKRFFKFFLILLAASLVSYMYDCFYLHEKAFSIKYFLGSTYKNPVSIALWYMYKYLAYILMLPLLRILAQNMDKKAFVWMFAMNGLISFLPIPEFIIGRGALSHYSGFSFFISSQYILYPLMGYYIAQRIREEELNKKTLAGLVIAGASAIILCSVMTHWKCTVTDKWGSGDCQTFFNTLIFIPSYALFYGARYFFAKHRVGSGTSRMIVTIGSATFGLFLLERICRKTTAPVFHALHPYMPTILACWIWIFTACVLGIVITLILKKVPFLAKVL